MSEVSQSPEPTSYVVEGNSYRQLIAERDAYKRIANDLARQLREIKPADTSAPPERASVETSTVLPCGCDIARTAKWIRRECGCLPPDRDLRGDPTDI